MTRYDQLVHALASGDIESALVFWRSKQWTDQERRRVERLLRTATQMRVEVLP
jgi:hypothetical protein